MEELQEAIRQISLSLKSLDESFEKRTAAVDHVCGKWENKLTALLTDCRDAVQEMQTVRDSLQWRKRTIIGMIALGFLGGTALLLLSLCLPGANSLMYRLILWLGR